jgi:hypothetical protein
MRILSIILAIIVLFLGIVLTFFRFGTLPLLPAASGLIFAYIAMRFSKGASQKKLPKILIFLAVLTALSVGFQQVFLKDEVVKDELFQQREEESQKKAMEELEELEKLEPKDSIS